ncbi:MAG: DUF2085 domain-containing protein [Acidobacteriota bacterium]
MFFLNILIGVKKEAVIYVFLLSFSIIIIFLIFYAPIVVNKFKSPSIYILFSNVCHQKPERTFFLFNFPLAVCSRCTGIYFGFFLGNLFLPILKRKFIVFPELKLIILATIPMALEYSGYILKLWNSNLLRMISGLSFGLIIPFYLIPSFLYIFNNKEEKVWKKSQIY